MNNDEPPKKQCMPSPDAANLTAVTRFDPAPPTPVGRPRKKLTKGLGYFTLFVATVAFLTMNSALLRVMGKDVSAQKQAAEEAKRPAEITVVAMVSPDCAACYNVSAVIANLGANQKIKITNPRTVDVGLAEGAALVKQYALTRSPAFIIRGQTEKLLAAVPGLKSLGQLQNGVFVGSNVPAPYVDLAAGKVRGTFTATYITEKSCRECYDPTINRQALAQFGMKAATEKTIDRIDPDGQKLIKQYAITSTPTLILTGDLAAYVGFDQAWKNVGTIEPDGAHVFRSGQNLMGTYYDLTTKKTVAPPKSAAAAPTP